MAVMAREAWTDERLDDLQKHMDEGFQEVKREQRELRGEVKALRKELKEDIGEFRSDVNSRFAQMTASFDRLSYTLIAALLGLLATHYLG